MPECKIFDHGICIGPTGAVRPCCAFMTRGVPSMYFNEDWKTRHQQWRDRSRDEWLSQWNVNKARIWVMIAYANITMKN